MSDAVFSAASIGELLSNDRDAMWIKGLSKYYGVNDSTIVHTYLRRARALSLDLGEEILRMLNLLPVSAIVVGSAPAALSIEALQNALDPVMDHGSMSQLSRLMSIRPNASVEAKELLFENWGGIRDLVHLGRQYMLREKPELQSEHCVATSLDGKHLIVAHVKGTGVFIGNAVHYFGQATNSGQQKLPAGWVFFGPRIDLDPGSYFVEIDIRLEDPEAELIFDVAANEGLIKLVAFESIGNVLVKLKFDVNEGQNAIEVRCVNPSGTDIVCDIRRVVIGQRMKKI